jgi:hypothetical protein
VTRSDGLRQVGDVMIDLVLWLALVAIVTVVYNLLFEQE